MIGPLQDELTAAPDTDVSGTLGFGTYFHPEWFPGDWDPSQQLSNKGITICYQELSPLCWLPCYGEITGPASEF